MNAAQQLDITLPDIIEPKWWTGEPAVPSQAYQIDCAAFAMSDADFMPGSELDQRMNEVFDRVGLVHLVNTGMTDMQQMRKAAMMVIKKQVEYKHQEIEESVMTTTRSVTKQLSTFQEEQIDVMRKEVKTMTT